MNKLFYFAIAATFIALGVFVIAQTPMTNPPPIVVNAFSCSETDGGLNYFLPGNVTGSFWWPATNGTNNTFAGTFSDNCVSNTILAEGVCGSSIGSTYNNLAGVLYVNCAVPGNSTGNHTGICAMGRCY